MRIDLSTSVALLWYECNVEHDEQETGERLYETEKDLWFIRVS